MPFCESAVMKKVLVDRDYLEMLRKEAGRRDICWYCGGQLVFGSDYDYEDMYGYGEGIVTELRCADCGAVVHYSIRDDGQQ